MGVLILRFRGLDTFEQNLAYFFWWILVEPVLVWKVVDWPIINGQVANGRQGSDGEFLSLRFSRDRYQNRVLFHREGSKSELAPFFA